MKRCGYCHRRGHNRATCERLKQDVRENPGSYTAKRYRARQAAKEERAGSNGKATRKCSYCKNTGHNKKTCPKIAADRKNMASKNRAFRKDFIRRCKAVGFGPGTLVEFKIPQGASSWMRDRIADSIDRYGKLGMVTGFLTEYVTCDLADENKYMGSMGNIVRVRFPNGKSRSVAMPGAFAAGLVVNDCISDEMHIACEVNQKSLEKCFSADWKTGKTSVDRQLGLKGLVHGPL